MSVCSWLKHLSLGRNYGIILAHSDTIHDESALRRQRRTSAWLQQRLLHSTLKKRCGRLPVASDEGQDAQTPPPIAALRGPIINACQPVFTRSVDGTHVHCHYPISSPLLLTACKLGRTSKSISRRKSSTILPRERHSLFVAAGRLTGCITLSPIC